MSDNLDYLCFQRTMLAAMSSSRSIREGYALHIFVLLRIDVLVDVLECRMNVHRTAANKLIDDVQSLGKLGLSARVSNPLHCASNEIQPSNRRRKVDSNFAWHVEEEFKVSAFEPAMRELSGRAQLNRHVPVGGPIAAPQGADDFANLYQAAIYSRELWISHSKSHLPAFLLVPPSPDGVSDAESQRDQCRCHCGERTYCVPVNFHASPPWPVPLQMLLSKFKCSNPTWAPVQPVLALGEAA